MFLEYEQIINSGTAKLKYQKNFSMHALTGMTHLERRIIVKRSPSL